MTERRLEPPSGDAAPTSAVLGDELALDLVALAREICLRYSGEYPDEEARYGDARHAWCLHDTQHLLNWSAEAVNGYVDLTAEVSWLASVLEARRFPLDRLARNLDIGAGVVAEQVTGPRGQELAAALADAATYVRSRETFLT